MAGSESAEMQPESDKAKYHKQCRAANNIKRAMVSIDMEIQEMERHKTQLLSRREMLAETLDLLGYAPLNIGKKDLPTDTGPRPCNEIPMPGGGDGVTLNPTVDLNSSFLEKSEATVQEINEGLNLITDSYRPAASEGQTGTVGLQCNPNGKPTVEQIALPEITPTMKYKPLEMHGLEWFTAINRNSVALEDHEGFWRGQVYTPYSRNSQYRDDALPFPVAWEIEDFDYLDFAQRVRDLQNDSGTEEKRYRGVSAHRWHGGCNGNADYVRGSWRWPSGYTNYLTEQVPPSRKFYLWVMEQHAELFPRKAKLFDVYEFAKRLPTYGRPA